jgi:hypothetical protein
MADRRLVRVAHSFFERLDEILPAERSPTGIPSATDFLRHDLVPLIDRLAADYEGSTTVFPSMPGVRVMVTSGMLIESMAIYCAVAHDGAVELIYLDVDDQLD